MNKLVTVLFLMVVTASCAHHHDKTGHHHHKDKKCDETCKMHNSKEMFEKHCALSVSEGDAHVHGSEEFKLKHGGKTYFFSSKEKMAQFEANLEENIKQANANWARYRDR